MSNEEMFNAAFNNLRFIVAKVDQVFNIIFENFNDIGIQVQKLVIINQYSIVFPEDFEDQKLFNAFRNLYDPETHTLSLSVDDVVNDINLLVMVIDAMYQNIKRICQIQYEKGAWDPIQTEMIKDSQQELKRKEENGTE